VFFKKTPKIKLLVQYFGKWPEWFDFHLLSCEYNPSIDWLFISDNPTTQKPFPNIEFYKITFPDYEKLLSKKLGFNVVISDFYKLCDYKPTLGLVFEEHLKGYDYWGYSDIDIIWGDIRKFLLKEKFQCYNCFSSHCDRLAGHFTLFRNTPYNINLFKMIKNYKALLENKEHKSVDETALTILIKSYSKPISNFKSINKIYSFFNPLSRTLFKEHYSTILIDMPWHNGSMDHPQVWYWKDGRVFNERDAGMEFMYLHFMNLKSKRWLPKFRGETAAWENKSSVINFPIHNKELYKEGFRIDRNGFSPLSKTEKQKL